LQIMSRDSYTLLQVTRNADSASATKREQQ
jgi:hypothetical protein